MARIKRNWNPAFLRYMDSIVNNPAYQGLPIRRKADGSWAWVATAQSDTGKARIAWCAKKATELGIPQEPGYFAKVMLEIHPTKWKVCQTCGKSMSLFYVYPNANFVKRINATFGTEFTDCDHVEDIWDELSNNGVPHETLVKFFADAGGLVIPNVYTTTKEEVLGQLEIICRNGYKACLGPGAMSNFPDRFDGFHTYNRCCRSEQDIARHKENLSTYVKDRRAYEYWSDGNIHAADKFMGSIFFNGASADHIGPISLGFVHDPRYLQRMPAGDNSAKRDRLLVNDVVQIIAREKNTGVYPMSWYSREIWEFIKRTYVFSQNKVATIYREALKQNMANFMYVLWNIHSDSINGDEFLTSAFLSTHFNSFQYDYTFNADGTIASQIPRHITGRMQYETERYIRKAINAVVDYNTKTNRQIQANLSNVEEQELDKIVLGIGQPGTYPYWKQQVEKLMINIQKRIISTL